MFNFLAWLAQQQRRPPVRDILSQVCKDLCAASLITAAGLFYTGNAYFAGAGLLIAAVVLFVPAVHYRQEK